MQSTSSVAQGTFVFLPDGFSLAKLKNTKKRKLSEKSEFHWENAFNKIWDSVNEEIKEINEQLFGKVLKELVEHMKKLHTDVVLSEGVIPCEILLTGTNLPDHKSLLTTFILNLNNQITPYVALLWSWNCGNIKSTVQNFVSQIIPLSKIRKKNSDDEDEDEDMSVDEESFLDDSLVENNDNEKSVNNANFLISQYNLSTLSSWYSVECKEPTDRKPVIIIIPDFEGFLPAVLGEFILLLSAYSSKIPFIIVFGVATTPVAVYQNLSRNVLSQLATQVFKSEPSTSLLNHVIENILFSERCPFRLGKKCMTFLTDIFLFHAFSVHGFIQGFKYCLIEHFYKKNHFTLTFALEKDVDNYLLEDEVENIRKLSSFQKHVENCSKEERKSLLLDDKYTSSTSRNLVKKVLEHTRFFHVALKILHILTSDLPKSPLGRNLREYYCKAVSDRIYESEEYKECMKLLELQSQNEMLEKIENLLNVVNSLPMAEVSPPTKKDKKLKEFLIKLEEFKKSFQSLSNGPSSEQVEEKEGENKYEVVRKKFLDHVNEEIVKELLIPPCELPLHEIVYFDDLTAIRRRISGSPRGAIHLALNNPQCYLNCKCCVLPNSGAILSSLPDLSIAYKIHLECNKMINMYDWLQSFVAVVKPEAAEAEAEVNKELQARFTKAVSELQFLGFIKPSRSKTDHVSRLTWGNC